jgi:phage baseplate assembly protein gpV
MGSENNFNYASTGSPDSRPGPFLATVIGHQDPTYMGTIEVELLRPTGNTSDETSIHQVKYMSPFYGVTSASHLGENDDYSSTQKSYGWWAVPPDVGTTVVVIFIDGDARRGYWIGCVQDEGMNFMVPGLAATQKVVEDVESDNAGNYGRVPVAEYNKKVNDLKDPDVTQLLKPKHPLADALDRQGLLFDDIRGITTSSARREVPSMVFGISTPGPVDKRDGAPRGRIGKKEWKIDNAFVGRLGGSTWVMDDGDSRFLRKKPASEGPPEYASLEDGDTDGDVEIPHNELIRIRTRTGHQILLHNSEDLIYITNARGTAWIELTSDGKIDVYAKDSISVRTENDLNFYADRDINMEAGRNFNLKVAERHQTEVGKDKICIVNGNVAIKVDGTQDETITGAHTQSFEATWDVTTGEQTNITVGAGFDLNTSDSNKLTSGGNMEIAAANTTISGGNINLNGPSAASAGSATAATVPEPLETIDNPTEIEGDTITSIMARVPTTEPYPHHENLDGSKFKPDATDREAVTAIEVPTAWKTYSTTNDTFKIIPPEAPPEEQQQ